MADVCKLCTATINVKRDPDDGNDRGCLGPWNRTIAGAVWSSLGRAKSIDKGRGYEISERRYIEIEPEEIKAIQVENRHTPDSESFVSLKGGSTGARFSAR